MARPQILQELRHGKLLTQGNFPSFVDTFNYAVNRIENIKGDADVRPNGGWVTVDNTDPEHPVIRLRNAVSSAASAVSVDTRNSGTGLSSIDYDLSNSLELRNFHLLQNEYIPSQYPVAGRGYDLVLRERLSDNRADIKYTDLSAFLDGLHLYIDSDSEFYDNNSIGASLRRNYD